MFSGFICCFFCLLERVMGFLMALLGRQAKPQHNTNMNAVLPPIPKEMGAENIHGCVAVV